MTRPLPEQTTTGSRITRPRTMVEGALDRTRAVRRRIGGLVIEGLLEGATRLGRLHPQLWPRTHDVERIRGIRYAPGSLRAHTLDVYRPRHHTGPLPVLLYVHGGAFRMLSKDTHYLFGIAFARRGYLVLNVNYRLAPKHPYPAGLKDVCSAYLWARQSAASFGGDPTRLVLAGESAGANLVTALTLATCFARPEPWAREVFDQGIRPSVVLPACGLFQASDMERFSRRKRVPAWLADRLVHVGEGYLPRNGDPSSRDLADPLVLLERDEAPERPLPPFFLCVGTRDPLLDDTRRLAAALERREVVFEARYYEKEVHAFHAMVWRRQARRCWRDMFAFLESHVPVASPQDTAGPVERPAPALRPVHGTP